MSDIECFILFSVATTGHQEPVGCVAFTAQQMKMYENRKSALSFSFNVGNGPYFSK